MFLAEMVWSCYPTHVFCCAFKVKGIQGDQSQPLVAAHPKLSGERTGTQVKCVKTSPLCAAKGWVNEIKVSEIPTSNPQKMVPKHGLPGLFQREGGILHPETPVDPQVNWTPPANLEATKYYSVQLEWVVCLDDFSIWCESLFCETVARGWVRFGKKHGTFCTSILVVVIFLGWGPNLWTP